MRHTRDEIIQRTVDEFKQLDRLVASLKPADWKRRVPRPETKDPWTVKDALAHITHWKADMIRLMKGERRPPEERGLDTKAGNRLVYTRWRNRPPQEVLAWHRQVHKDVMAAIKAMPEDYFSGKDRPADWLGDLDHHSAHHRVHDIEGALAKARD